MALNFLTQNDVAQAYLQKLKALKPEVNIAQTDSDWWVKAQALGGIGSGSYADQLKVQRDIFPQSARHDALVQHLQTYGLGDPIQAQDANGIVAVTGAIGTVYALNQIFQYDPNGNTYQATTATTLAATTGTVPVTSVNAGQNQNLLAGSLLSMPSAPAGHQAAAVQIMADGRDDETDPEIAARIIAFIQSPPNGGTEDDYKAYATGADPSVTSAQVLRYPFGLGTVAIYITSGTTDIDTAIDNGQAIVRQPSPQLLAIVSAAIKPLRPITDCHTVYGAIEVPQDVTVNASLSAGLQPTDIPAGFTLTYAQLVAREVNRALYKIPTGGRTIGASGYVLASEIEEALDYQLSAENYTEGAILPCLIDRQVQNLSASGANRVLLPNELVTPGTITVVFV